MAFDLETSQLSPWKSGGSILAVSWSGKDNVARVSRDIAGFFEACAKRSPILIGHNVKFDLAWAKMAVSYSHAGPIHDTMVLAHLTDENRPSKGLKYLASHYTGYGDYGAGVMAYRNRGQMEKLDEKTLFEYCAHDSAATWLIYQYLAKELEDQGLELLYRAQMRVLMTLLGMEQRGFQVSLERAKVLEVEMGSKADRMARSIVKRMGIDVNLDSNKQLAKALFEDLGYKPHTLTKARQPSVGEESLELLRDQVPAGLSRQKSMNLINDILERRKLKKVVSTYLTTAPDNVDDQERIHPTYNLTGTPTGRLSCSDPNMQNIPREANAPVKQIFVAPKGRVLVVADYSQIELRIVAWKTRDETMLRFFDEGLDLHTETARSILGHEPTSEERSHAKTVNFGVLYGMGVYALAKQTGKPVAWAKDYLKNWALTYPAVPNWKGEIKRELQERGYVTNAFGRRRRLPVHIAGGPKEYEKMLRQACNHPIQGTAGELCLFAMVLVEEVLSRKLESAWIIGQVHDNIIVECRWGDRKRGANIMRKVMTNATAVVAEFGFDDIDFDVPTPVKVKAGRCWAEMEEV
jgi:DNA polymerase-1